MKWLKRKIEKIAKIEAMKAIKVHHRTVDIKLIENHIELLEYVKNVINSEQLIDEIVERINRKQVKR